MEAFFELVQMAVGCRDSLDSAPRSREEWETLFKVTGQHSLLGITFPVIDRLHDEMEIPLAVYSRWAMVAEKIAAKNKYQKEAGIRLRSLFAEAGFRTCLLKGQAAAALYPEPSLRQSGDVDVWVEGERDAILDFLHGKQFPLGKTVYHHCDVKMFKGSGVEVHFTPSWMNAPGANRRLQKWFASHADAQFGNYDETLGMSVPTIAFDAVYMLIHIYRHVLEEGVGLRQLLDYYYVLQHLPQEDRSGVVSDIRHLRLGGFAAAVMYVLQQAFKLEDGCLLFTPDPREGGFLLDEIMRSGNFGRYDSRNAHDKGEGLVAHGRRKFGRGVRFFLHYPSEVFWMPLFMIWQYFWRRKNGFLYKGR